VNNTLKILICIPQFKAWVGHSKVFSSQDNRNYQLKAGEKIFPNKQHRYVYREEERRTVRISGDTELMFLKKNSVLLYIHAIIIEAGL
jgi:hypothetical protein